MKAQHFTLASTMFTAGLLTALLASSLATTVQAGEAAKLFAGISFGKSDSDTWCKNFPLECDDNSSMTSATLGYRASDHMNVELSYVDLGKFSSKDIKGEATTTTMSVVGKWPLDPRFGVMGKLGLAFSHLKAKAPKQNLSLDERNTGGAVGIGVYFRVARDLDLRLEYELLSDAGNGEIEDDIKTISAGAFYHF